MRHDRGHGGGGGVPERPPGFEVDSNRLIDHSWHWDTWSDRLRQVEMACAPGGGATPHFGRVMEAMGAAHDRWHRTMTRALQRGQDSCADTGLALRRAAREYADTDARHAGVFGRAERELAAVRGGIHG